MGMNYERGGLHYPPRSIFVCLFDHPCRSACFTLPLLRCLSNVNNAILIYQMIRHCFNHNLCRLNCIETCDHLRQIILIIFCFYQNIWQ